MEKNLNKTASDKLSFYLIKRERSCHTTTITIEGKNIMKKIILVIGISCCLFSVQVSANEKSDLNKISRMDTPVASSSEAILPNNEMQQLEELEILASEYQNIADKTERFNDIRKEVMIYIRSKQYHSTAWNICAGSENSKFTSYVEEKSPQLISIRNYGTFQTPFTNERSKFVHMIGALNMAYCEFGELGSWAGDLVQLTRNLKNKYSINEDLDYAASQLLCGNSQFTKEEMIADLDAININALLKEDKSLMLTEAFEAYYKKLSEEPDYAIRYQMFIKNQTGHSVISYEKLYSEVEKIMKKDAFVEMLLNNNNIDLASETDIKYLNASIKAFTDYIYKHCPESMIVDDSYFEELDTNSGSNSQNGNSDDRGTSLSERYSNGSGKTNHQISPQMDITMTGTWYFKNNTWKYYSFSGIETVGWQKLLCETTSYWFYFNEAGIMQTGWLVDPTGNTFYLNEISDGTKGRMVIGWNKINGNWYYFNINSDGTQGRLLKDTLTPDGYRVNEVGVYVE